MPQAIAVFTAVGSFLGFVGTAAVIVGAVVTVGALYLAQKLLAPEVSTIRGTLLNKEGSSSPIPVVYGERRLGGHRTFLKTNGSKNSKLHLIFTLCEGPIYAIDKIWFNDELAASSADRGATWTFHNGYGGKLYIEAYKGDQTTASAALVAENIGWTSAHVGRGLAYLYLRFTYDEDVYDSGLPEITATIRGKTVIKPWESSALIYSTNPALVIHDYMYNSFYGKGIPSILINRPQLQEAYNYYDEIVTNSDATTEKRYEINAVLDTEQKMFDNLQELLLACRSSIVTGEQYQLLPDKALPTDNIYHINDDLIVGNITYLQANKRSLLNEARAKFPDKNDPDYNYKENFVIVKSPTLQSNNYDGVKLKTDIDMKHTTSGTMVERILTEEINQSRQSGVLSVVTTTQLMETTVGDIVSFTNDTLGQTGKLYRIIGQVLTQDHNMELTLKEYDPNCYWDNNQSVIINNKDDTDHEF